MSVTIVTSGHADMQGLILGCIGAKKHVLHVHMVQSFLSALTIAGMGLLGAHFSSDATGMPQEFDKMHQNHIMQSR